MRFPTLARLCLQGLTALLVATGMPATLAAPLPVDELERMCWLSYSSERTRINLREPTSVSFSNLRNGYSVVSPFLVDFAVRGMGVVPAGKPLQGAGHHHLLIDTRLPASVSQKIPFDDTHKHFGRGQTNTLLELPPGRHTLRLLFADHDHRPYFVFSPEITVEVRGPRVGTPRPKIDASNFQATCASWYQDAVSSPRSANEPLHVTNIRDKEVISSPFNVRLGVDGFGVCAKGQSAEKSGYFLLSLLRRSDRKVVESFDLSNGATQTTVSVAPNNYILRLRFVDPVRAQDLLPPHELNVTVDRHHPL